MASNPLSRSVLRHVFSSAVILWSCTLSMGLRAELTTPVLAINQEAAHADITVQPLRGGVSVLIGSGGNIGVLSGPDGKLMVDAGIAVSKARLASALEALGPGPVRYVINTHYHWDHTDGNAWLHDGGAIIVAHENTLARLTAGTRVIDWSYAFPPVPPAGLPTAVVTSDKAITFGDETVLIRYQGSGHTDTDLTAYFTKADILMVGDIWWNGFYPFIDYSGGGGIDGVIRQVDACIAASTNHTLIVPGHGPIGDRAQLVEFRDMLVGIRRNVAELKHQGKTLAETVAAKPTAAWDARFGQFLIDPAFFTHLVYTGV
jgi:glyoxylase-like metal-dependent hydrolase (beta-lactamase superfamily II)